MFFFVFQKEGEYFIYLNINIATIFLSVYRNSPIFDIVEHKYYFASSSREKYFFTGTRAAK